MNFVMRHDDGEYVRVEKDDWHWTKKIEEATVFSVAFDDIGRLAVSPPVPFDDNLRSSYERKRVHPVAVRIAAAVEVL